MGACLCPHLLSVMFPHPSLFLLCLRLPHPALRGPGALPVCLSVTLCSTLPPSLSVLASSGLRGLAGARLDSSTASTEREGAQHAVSAGGAQAPGGTEPPPPGPLVLAGGQQAGCEGTRVALPHPLAPGAPLTRAYLPAEATPSPTPTAPRVLPPI